MTLLACTLYPYHTVHKHEGIPVPRVGLKHKGAIYTDVSSGYWVPFAVPALSLCLRDGF